MAYRFLSTYAFVVPESEQNSSHPTFQGAPASEVSNKVGGLLLGLSLIVWKRHPLPNDRPQLIEALSNVRSFRERREHELYIRSSPADHLVRALAF
jgi:hypothetical protein